jgi:hypothetical protein
MKPLPPPSVPGNTDWQRFDNAVRKVFSVSPEAIEQETLRMKQEREKKKRTKKAQ